MKRRVMIVLAAGLVLAGVFVIAFSLVGSGAAGRLNKKYNIFNMVDDSLETMREMNGLMAKVKSNVDVLDGKLGLLGRTNDLLEEQLAVVDRLNGQMASQKPLLNETNASISGLHSKLLVTLDGVTGLGPVMNSLVSTMQSAVDLTAQATAGTGAMVGIGSNISGLFDQTLAYLARIQPLSLKAKAYMKGDILSRLGQFMPQASASRKTTPGAGRTTIPGTPQNLTGQLVNGVNQLLQGTVGTVNQVTRNLLNPLLDPVKQLLK